MESKVTAVDLRLGFIYSLDSGLFVRAESARCSMFRGTLAGSTDAQGYRILTLRGLRFKAHRAAWCYVHGEWPVGVIDHINGERADNRIANLRCVTAAENRQNQRCARSDSRTGLLGVTPRGAAFEAVIRSGNKRRSFGTFATPQEAHIAAIAAKRVLHPAFAG